ncbi:MAG: hypothetical protein CR974_00295 [Gammaproteobacteria bacterium]|nr:MAG: hypothetical protein CR974_00295 [Gammaproteobacteria bacterium]
MKKIFPLLAGTFLLMACATSTQLNSDGSPAGELHWPNPKDVQFDHQTGTFPNLENLSKIRPNMSRDQLYDLIGRPHFTEGFHVREWTYLFHFNTPNVGTNGVTTCEYKVLFDKDLRAQNYYWKPIDPANATCPPRGKRKIFTLSADALFAFDKSDLSHMTAGREKLDNLIANIQQLGAVKGLELRGYTDYLGSGAYNQNLSQRRVETVRRYLHARGVNVPMTAYGYGESYPVVSCPRTGNRQALIRCLAPNRRVEVEVK